MFSGNLSTKFLLIFGFIIFPILINISYIFFIAFGWNSNLTICIIVIIWYYICGLVSYVAFRMSTGIWQTYSESGFGGIFLNLLIVIFYPIYFLIMVPFTVYHVYKCMGSPRRVWQRIFEHSFMNLESLHLGDSTYCTLIGRYVYIGIPFALFALIYLILVFIFFPIYYVFFSPFGLGPVGVTIFHSLPKHSDFSEYFQEFIQNSLFSSLVIYVFIYGFGGVLYAVIYLVVVTTVQWQMMLLFVLCILYIILFIVPVLTKLCCRSAKQYV